MGLCPSSCGDITLIGNPLSDCVIAQRENIVSRLFFYPCSVTLPDPISDVNIKPLFDDRTIVASSELFNVVAGDPDIEEVGISDCRRPIRTITGRELTAEDRIKVEATQGSPGVLNKFFDYDFWLDKQDQQFVLNVMIGYCNGDVIIPVDRNGDPLSVSVLAFLNWQKPTTAGANWVEFKSLSFQFDGDPFGLHIKPAFNWKTAGIQL